MASFISSARWPRTLDLTVRQSTSANELDLLTFFEAEPKRADRDVPWPYNEFSYDVIRGEFRVLFTIAPAYLDVKLLISRNSNAIYTLDAKRVEDVVYHNDNGRETLAIVLGTRQKILLRLRPSVFIAQEAEGEI